MGMGKGPVGPDFTNIGVVPVMVTTPFKSTGVSEESESLPSGPTYRQVDCSRGPTHAGPPGQGHPQHSFCGRPWVELKKKLTCHGSSSTQVASAAAIVHAVQQTEHIQLHCLQTPQTSRPPPSRHSGRGGPPDPRRAAAPRHAARASQRQSSPVRPPTPPGSAPAARHPAVATRGTRPRLVPRVALSGRGPSLGPLWAIPQPLPPGPPPPFHSPFPRPQGPLPTPQEDRLSSEERRPPPPQRRRRIRQRIPPPGTVTGPPFPGV